jgi:hypothetical protein
MAYMEEAGDPYKAEMEECVELIMATVKSRGIHSPHILAYQVNVSAIVSIRKLYLIDDLDKCDLNYIVINM